MFGQWGESELPKLLSVFKKNVVCNLLYSLINIVLHNVYPEIT